MPILPVETQIIGLLQAGHAITVRWDCGGDEGFVYTSVDGVEQDADYRNPEDFPWLLDNYLTELLDLPSVGEFEMKGTGRLFQEGTEVVIEYQSEAITYWDDESEDWMEDYSEEQLAEMGYVKPIPEEQPANETDPKPAQQSPFATTPAAEEEEDKREIDQEMSAEYTGRRVLFRVG